MEKTVRTCWPTLTAVTVVGCLLPYTNVRAESGFPVIITVNFDPNFLIRGGGGGRRGGDCERHF